MAQNRWFWLVVTGGLAVASTSLATAAVERAAVYFVAYVVCLGATLSFVLLCLTAVEEWLTSRRQYRSVGVCQDLRDDQ